ncbi:hypothetical protein HRbin19_00801 [bacterium HR19]|nr:hypothetical protein HRbin19_00801 [bacterium HR19]
MEEKEKRRRGKEGRKGSRAKAQRKQDTPEVEQNIQSEEKTHIQEEFRAETEIPQVEQTAEDYQKKETLPFPISIAINEFNKIKEKISSRVQVAKNLYSLFQGMRQMYGGDTRKVIQVIAGFAKEEAKRRINEAKNKVKEKIGLKTKEK